MDKIINKNFDSNYLINYCLIYRRFDIIKKILKIDEFNYINIKYNTLINIVKIEDFETIFNLLELVNDNGISYILNPNKLHNEKKQSWIIFYFMKANEENILKLLKYNKFIDWNIKIGPFYPLNILINTYYNKELSNNFKYIFKIILNESKKVLQDITTSIISESCINGFNKYILDKLIKTVPNIINKFDIHNKIPLYYSIINNKLFYYLLDKGANYNFASSYYNIFILTVIYGDVNMILKLLKYKDLDFKYYNNYRNNISLILFSNTNKKYSYKIKREILERTENINLQNIYGNTTLHYILLNDNWMLYSDILIKKKLNIFNKNKYNIRPIDLVKKKEMDDFFLLVAKSYMKSYKKVSIINAENNNKYKLYKSINKNSKSINKNNYQMIIKKMKKYKESILEIIPKIDFINSDDIYFSLFTSNIEDKLIYVLYLIKKFNIGIPIYKVDKNHKYTSIIHNIKNKIFNDNVKYYFDNLCNIMFSYNNFQNLSIFWYDIDNFLIPDNLSISCIQCKSKIIYIHLVYIFDSGLHANCFIIDKNKKIILRFDPAGQIKNNNNIALDNIMSKYFLSIYKRFTYLTPNDYMNINSFQSISNEMDIYETKYGDIGGFCLAWTILFIQLYISNQKIKIYDLIELIIDKIITNYSSITDYIRNYTNKLTKYRLKFLKYIDFPNDKIYSNILDSELKHYIYEKVNFELEIAFFL
jgi:hypothetical protein